MLDPIPIWRGNRSTGQAEITPSQAKFLAQRLDDIDLSVRSSNCLKNINIEYLGELVQYSAEDLLRVQNFGRKSLKEIVALFANEGLLLGLCLPEWSPESVSAVPDQIAEPTPS